MSSAAPTMKSSFEQEKHATPSSGSQEASKEEEEVQEEVAPPPDGGLDAWMTVVATFLASFMAFGTGNVWGIYQDAYTTRSDSRFLDVSLFKIGFVGGTAVGFGFAVGPFGNILVAKFGIRAPILLGVLMMTVALMLASIATKYWELLLSQGIMFGIGSSLAYIPAIGLPSQWFDKRRGLATGIASSGSGIGAVILSPIVQTAIDNLGIPWALRIVGFLCFVCGMVSLALLRQRVASKKQVQYKVFDLSVLRVPMYPLYLVFAFLQFFGYVTPIFFIPGYCTALGISGPNTSAVLSVTAAVNSIGRVLAGRVADHWGVLNVMISFNFLSGVMVLAVWLVAKNLGDMMGFGVLWGIFSGAYWALSVPTSAKIVGMERLGSAAAIQFLMNVIPPMFASPIGARIIAGTSSANGISQDSREAYKYLIVFCALAPMVASLLLVPVRLHFSKKLFAKV
ncbi:major facilitator superfamily domain-containing protein [Fomitopsis serialis]|uniref:major facilitator superfamily domain-containing protein n=1 Tax=Fomitopsis serialis TaxID=139415 RepID=UPI002008E8BF|nr:major facilitator superfamily domain-containing protein [Neoantrodia serialis]KAH9924765.1 major facilitator superfamily domain-containing protein [Neoantrodia serialis]